MPVLWFPEMLCLNQMAYNVLHSPILEILIFPFLPLMEWIYILRCNNLHYPCFLLGAGAFCLQKTLKMFLYLAWGCWFKSEFHSSDASGIISYSQYVLCICWSRPVEPQYAYIKDLSSAQPVNSDAWTQLRVWRRPCSFTDCKCVASVCWYEVACVILNICMLVLIQCVMTTIHVLEEFEYICLRVNVIIIL